MGCRRTRALRIGVGLVDLRTNSEGECPPGQRSRPAHDACRLRRAARTQIHIRSAAAGPAYGAGAHAWDPAIRKRLDAFPSGHAVHIGALASAATVLPPTQRNAVWAIGGGLVLTRIVVLAHWTSDVVAGLAVGVALERLLRLVTGFGRRDRRRNREATRFGTRM
jgi:membrane-associated phospholipid phosphatase